MADIKLNKAQREAKAGIEAHGLTVEPAHSRHGGTIFTIRNSLGSPVYPTCGTCELCGYAAGLEMGIQIGLVRAYQRAARERRSSQES